MTLHVLRLPEEIIKLMWVLPEGAEFKKADYDATVVIAISPIGGYVELRGFVGYKYKGQRNFTKKQYIKALKYFRSLQEKYDLHVRAERIGNHVLPGFEQIGKYLFLKG